jgi:hypothetical protein
VGARLAFAFIAQHLVVAAQVEIGSKVCKRFIRLWLQELKSGAFNTAFNTIQPAPAHLVARVAGGGFAALHRARQPAHLCVAARLEFESNT